jgi:uncharacterized protein with GYD domain
MLFCVMANYTPQSINALMDHTESRQPAVQKLVEAAGGKLVSMYSTAMEGPGVMVIIDMPDPDVAPAISGVAAASGALKDIKFFRLLSQNEVVALRKKAAELRKAYTPPST